MCGSVVLPIISKYVYTVYGASIAYLNNWFKTLGSSDIFAYFFLKYKTGNYICPLHNYTSINITNDWGNREAKNAG